MKQIFRLILVTCLVFVSGACQEVYMTDRQMKDDSIDSNYEFTYGIREFIEYDAKNPGGVNLLPFFDFFKTFSLKIYVEKGKIAYLEIDNGELPCSEYSFTLPEGKVACYYDETAVPHALKLENGDVIAVFQDGEFVLNFVLDYSKISYKMTFTTVDSTREK